MIKMTALYERSTHADQENIRRQKKNLETYAKTKRFENLYHFTDSGFSANDQSRPGYAAMLQAVEAGKISTIIVRDAGRLAHDLAALLDLIKDLQDRGVRIIMLNEKIDLLPPHIHDDENGLDYTLHGDYYLPNLIDDALEDHRPLGKWGMMRLDYLKNHRPGLYASMLLSGKLHTHLADLDEQARDRQELVVGQMKQAEGISEQLKMRDQMTWVGMMNNIAARADEIIRDELIFS